MTPEELAVLTRIANEAAEVISRIYATPFSVDYKGPRDPVTAADREANTLICERLAEEFPGVPVVAEESAPALFSGFRRAERVFFVDPVDGTREFVDRNGQFAVMIGVLEENVATAGVILAPALSECWMGAVSQGAFRVLADGSRTPVRVSECLSLGEAKVVASRSHRSDYLDRVMESLNAREVSAVGSAGLKAARVAEGSADVYIAPNYAGQRWDACAADALVRAAGGRFTDQFGDALDYRAESLVNDRGMVASNGRLHDALLEHLARARRS